MATETDPPSLDVDSSELTSLLRAALQDPALRVVGWEAQPLHGGMEFTSAVYRLSGRAEQQSRTIPWSLILKVVQGSSTSGDPQGAWYDRREAGAYQSGLLQRLPGKISAPRCYGVQERPDGSIRLWLEDVHDEIGSPWPLAHYGVVARQLGEWNGAYLVGEPLPSEPWVSRDWVRRYVEHAAPAIGFIRQNPDHPLVKGWFPGSTLAQLLAFWDERNRYLDALARLPQVFCHQDAFKRNLFARHDGTVAIDWSFAGTAPVGAELSALVLGSVGLYEVPFAQVGELDRLCFEGYLQGLRDAGWQGPARAVRLGYTVYTVLRYIIGATVGEGLPAMLDEGLRARWMVGVGQPVANVERTEPALASYYERLVVEALRLLGVGEILRFLGGTARHTISLRRGQA